MRIRNFPREVWRDSVSSGNLAKTISFSHPVIVWEIRVHLSARFRVGMQLAREGG